MFTESLTSRWLPATQWERNQWAVTISAALIFAGFTLVMPFLPLYIQMLGVTSPSQVALWAGVVLGISPLLASAVGPLWGRLADRVGLKIMALRITAALFLIWFLTGFSTSIYELFFLRALLGLLGGFNTFSIALVTQLAPKEKAGRLIGTLQATQIFSAAIGPFLGRFLAGWIGIRKTFFITSTLCLLSLLLFLLLYRDRPAGDAPLSKSGVSREHHSFRALLGLPNIFLIACLLFLITAIDRAFAPVIPLFVARLLESTQDVARVAGIIISLAAFAESFAAWYSGRKLVRTAPGRFLLWRLVSGCVVCTVLVLSGSVLQLLSLRVLLALLAGGTLTVAYTVATRVIPATDRAASFGMLSSFAMLGGAAGPMLGGLLASLDIRLVFAVDALLYGLLAGLICRKLGRMGKDGGIPTRGSTSRPDNRMDLPLP